VPLRPHPGADGESDGPDLDGLRANF